jgi:hypothetical protein
MPTPLARLIEYRDATLAAALSEGNRKKRAALLETANSWNELIRAVNCESVLK